MAEDRSRFIRSIAIVGGGTAGWMMAAALSKTLNENSCAIKVIESPDVSTVGVGEATIPPIQLFNQMLGIDENEFLSATNGTFKLGIEFSNWKALNSSYFHPFGRYGADIESVPFHQYWRKMRRLARAGELLEYSLPAMAAQRNKFCPPEKNPRSVLSNVAYAYHFDAGLYAQFLRQYAHKRGVERLERTVSEVSLDSDSGFIDTLFFEDSSSLKADFYVDCTGFRGLLIEGALKTGYEDWSHYLPCNRAVAVPCEQRQEPIPYTRSIAREAGWQWRIPLQHRLGNGYVFCSAFCGDEQATDTLMESLEGKALGDPKVLKFTTGRRKKSWNKNCLAIGLAAGFMEPLESTSIHMIQSAISRLMKLFPDRDFESADIDEYNQLTEIEAIRIRDFLVLHYKATEREDSPLWQYTKHMKVPETLQHKLDLYQSRGRVFRYDEELFSDTSWVAVFEGQGISPREYDPLVESFDQEHLEAILNKMRATIASGVDAMPLHAEYIASHCRGRVA